MADIFDAKTRSRIMACVKSKDTSPEMAVRRAVHTAGHRFRLHRKDLPGRPDLVFLRYKLAVFVHGCFWHGHDCRRGARMPASNRAYWMVKIKRNADRDMEARAKLQSLGWTTYVIWECRLAEGMTELIAGLDSRRLEDALRH